MHSEPLLEGAKRKNINLNLKDKIKDKTNPPICKELVTKPHKNLPMTKKHFDNNDIFLQYNLWQICFINVNLNKLSTFSWG